MGEASPEQALWEIPGDKRLQNVENFDKIKKRKWTKEVSEISVIKSDYMVNTVID